jgi:hypothetical protein
MATSNLNKKGLKRALKEALAETLQEQRELLHDVFAEVLEDFTLAEAIHEGQKTAHTTRDDVFRLLGGHK